MKPSSSSETRSCVDRSLLSSRLLAIGDGHQESLALCGVQDGQLVINSFQPPVSFGQSLCGRDKLSEDGSVSTSLSDRNNG